TRRGADELRRGHSLMAFPEGTRTVDGRVKEFKKGVFYMAIEAGGSGGSGVVKDTRPGMRKGVKSLVPRDGYLGGFAPVSARDYTSEDVLELINRVRDMIKARVRVD